MADLFLSPEPREFQASPLLLPVPMQVAVPAGRVASLLENHAMQLSQHVGRDRPGDDDWLRRAPRLPTQVQPGAGLPAAQLLLRAAVTVFPLGPLPVLSPRVPPLSLLPLCIYLPNPT